MTDKDPAAFRTISEVADDLDLPQHVLRFWETKFSQIRPMKSSGGRRFYRPDDIVLLRAIREMLYGQGYTIKGVQRLLKERGARGLAAGQPTTIQPQSVLVGVSVPEPVERIAPSASDARPASTVAMPKQLQQIRDELTACVRLLRDARVV